MNPLDAFNTHRRLVPGEVTQAGDLIRVMDPLGTAPAPAGVQVTDESREIYLCPKDRIVPEAVLQRALARFSLFTIENTYRIEEGLTRGFSAKRCFACRAKGEPNEDAIACNIEAGDPGDDAPLQYDHKPDCPTRIFTHLLIEFGELFRIYLESRGLRLHTVADIKSDDEPLL